MRFRRKLVIVLVTGELVVAYISIRLEPRQSRVNFATHLLSKGSDRGDHRLRDAKLFNVSSVARQLRGPHATGC